jgi:hypothetical protein
MRTIVSVSAAVLLTGLVPVPAAAAPVTITASPTGLQTIHAVSYTGRYAVGAAEPYGRLRLVDTQTGRLLKKLPKKATEASMSDTGRYVSYSVPLDEYGKRAIKVYDRRKDRTITATRRTNGALLTPAWRSRCTPAICEEDQKLTFSPQLVGGQISGNGRFVVFSANYRKPAGIDLYVKNLRSGRLTIFKSVGQPLVAEGDREYVQAPSVSQDASTILLPGRVELYESYENSWGPSRALRDRSSWLDIGGVGNTMTGDGRLITVNGPATGTALPGPSAVSWYDVTTGISTAADPATLRLTRNDSSRDGRYTLWRPPGYTDPIQIRDRTGISYDLEAALVAAGYSVSMHAGHAIDPLWRYSSHHSAMSGDGRVAFVLTNVGVLAVRWAP